ncbi:MAG: hypothetical protein ACI8Q2_000616, partial [Candidatus Omnitrophota bacterium]
MNYIYKNIIRRLISCVLVIVFSITSIGPVPFQGAQEVHAQIIPGRSQGSNA